MSSNLKCSILFGAGAEYCFGLPTGPRFTLDTLIFEDQKLTDSLKGHFERINNENPNIVPFINRKDSLIFREMIFDTLIYIYKNKSNISAYNNYKDKIEKYILKDGKLINSVEDIDEATKKFIIRRFDKIKNGKDKILDNHEHGIVNSIEDLLCRNLQFFGSVERYFYVLTNPKKYGLKYYQLFNYYWAAYFSILLSLIKDIKEVEAYFKTSDNKYKDALTNLNDILKTLYDRKKFRDFRRKHDINNYYRILFSRRKHINITSILTTNYTPFIRWYFPKKMKISYLAGELNLFENARNNKVGTIDNFKNKNEEFFPFIMTQAPIKPIVHPVQIKEYNNAITSLDESDVLIIIGYSLSSNDNHISAMIKDYLSKSTRKHPRYIINCVFSEQELDVDKVKKDTKEKLKITDKKYDENIVIIQNDGSAKTLYKKIQDVLDNIKLKSSSTVNV